MTIHLTLTPEQEQQLRDAARRLNIAPEALAAAVVRDLLAQPGADFQRVAGRLIEKNRELYRRLA